jgi:hypothetical protein
MIIDTIDSNMSLSSAVSLVGPTARINGQLLGRRHLDLSGAALLSGRVLHLKARDGRSLDIPIDSVTCCQVSIDPLALGSRARTFPPACVSLECEEGLIRIVSPVERLVTSGLWDALQKSICSPQTQVSSFHRVRTVFPQYWVLAAPLLIPVLGQKHQTVRRFYSFIEQPLFFLLTLFALYGALVHLSAAVPAFKDLLDGIFEWLYELLRQIAAGFTEAIAPFFRWLHDTVGQWLSIFMVGVWPAVTKALALFLPIITALRRWTQVFHTALRPIWRLCITLWRSAVMPLKLLLTTMAQTARTCFGPLVTLLKLIGSTLADVALRAWRPLSSFYRAVLPVCTRCRSSGVGTAAAKAAKEIAHSSSAAAVAAAQSNEVGIASVDGGFGACECCRTCCRLRKALSADLGDRVNRHREVLQAAKQGVIVVGTKLADKRAGILVPGEVSSALPSPRGRSYQLSASSLSSASPQSSPLTSSCINNGEGIGGFRPTSAAVTGVGTGGAAGRGKGNGDVATTTNSGLRRRAKKHIAKGNDDKLHPGGGKARSAPLILVPLDGDQETRKE